MDNKDNPQNRLAILQRLQLFLFITLRIFYFLNYFVFGLFVLLVVWIKYFSPPGCPVHGSGYKLKTDSQELQIALEQYADRYGNLPTEEQGIMALVEMPTLAPIPKNYKPILNKKRAVLDPWQTPYVLKNLANGDYAIITLGKDKKEGGEGKNADFNIMKEEEYPKELQ